MEGSIRRRKSLDKSQILATNVKNLLRSVDKKLDSQTRSPIYLVLSFVVLVVGTLLLLATLDWIPSRHLEFLQIFSLDQSNQSGWGLAAFGLGWTMFFLGMVMLFTPRHPRTERTLFQNTGITIFLGVVSVVFRWILNVVLSDVLDECARSYLHRTMVFVALCLVSILFKQSLVQKISQLYHQAYYLDKVANNDALLDIVSILKRFAFARLGISTTIQERYEDMDFLFDSDIQALRPKELEQDSLDLAQIIFTALKTFNSAETIQPEDLCEVFPKDQASAAFNRLDQDGNGDLTLEEMQDFVYQVYKQKYDLTRSLIESGNIIKQLGIALDVLVGLAIITFFCLVFGLSTSFLTTVGTVALTLGFLLSPLAVSMFNSIIFIFFKHPYDLGDCVCIDNEYRTVNDIGILTTTFVDQRGELIYAPNAILMSKEIKNLQRSPNRKEELVLNVSPSLPTKKLAEFKDALTNYIKRESRSFVYSDKFFDIEAVGLDSVRIVVRLEYKSNQQDYFAKRNELNKFVLDNLKLVS